MPSLNYEDLFITTETDFLLFLPPLMEIQRKHCPCFISAHMESLGRFDDFDRWQVFLEDAFCKWHFCELSKTNRKAHFRQWKTDFPKDEWCRLNFWPNVVRDLRVPFSKFPVSTFSLTDLFSYLPGRSKQLHSFGEALFCKLHEADKFLSVLLV